MDPEVLNEQVCRRHFLGRASSGIGAAAIASLLNPRLFASVQSPNFNPKAKRIIWLTQAGAPSQLELFDYKPGLQSQFDKELPNLLEASFGNQTNKGTNETRKDCCHTRPGNLNL